MNFASNLVRHGRSRSIFKISQLPKEKEAKLKQYLQPLERVIVAYSGGVDSTYLLYMAGQTLGGDNVVAVIACSLTYPVEEAEAAIKIAGNFGVNCLIMRTEEINDENFLVNSKERCYYCKKELFLKLRKAANGQGIQHLLDGSNADDMNDYRPGNRAKAEFAVKSPLQEIGFTKEEIRLLSKEAGLITWDKPSLACLASRIPYGRRIDREVLGMVEKGEKLLKALGFRQVRVRHHGNTARIEVEQKALAKFMEEKIRRAVADEFKKIGFTYVTVDLAGYRTGSLNEVLGG